MYKIQRGWITPRKQDPLNEHEQCSYELTKTEATCTRRAQDCTRPSVYILWIPVQGIFYDIPQQTMSGSLVLAICLTLSLCLSFLTAKCSSFYFIPSNPVHFLMRKCKQIVFPLELQKDGCPHDSWVLTQADHLRVCLLELSAAKENCGRCHNSGNLLPRLSFSAAENTAGLQSRNA